MSDKDPNIAAEFANLDDIKSEIDSLKDKGPEQLVDPLTKAEREDVLTAEPTDAIGADSWKDTFKNDKAES